MPWIFVALAVALSAAQSTCGKLNSRVGGDPYLFNLYKSGAAFVLFFITMLCMREPFHLPTLLYALGYGACLTVSMYCGYQAISTGPMAIANVVASFSLIFPVFFGVFFMDEHLSGWGIAGLALIGLSLVFINCRGGTSGVRMTARWWGYTLLTMLANGAFAITQIVYQKQYGDPYRFSFMAWAMLLATLVFLLLCFWKRCWHMPRRAVLFSLSSGVTNGLYNLTTFCLISLLSVSLIFPIIAVCVAAAIVLISWCGFGERLNGKQLFGFVLGILAVFLMNI